MASEHTKKRKLNPPPLRRPPPSAAKQMQDAMPVAAPNAHRVDIRVQQARDFAVAQAQLDGCTGNYKIFDSPFENFLIPVVPTRAELSG